MVLLIFLSCVALWGFVGFLTLTLLYLLEGVLNIVFEYNVLKSVAIMLFWPVSLLFGIVLFIIKGRK